MLPTNRPFQKQNTSKDPEEDLSLAARDYNINNIKGAESLINHTKCGTMADCPQKVWYLRRLLEINNASIIHEDRDCHLICTQQNLTVIHDKISDLSQLGYNLQFYNDKSSVDILEKPLEIFVQDLHSLTIISLIIVFVVLLAMRGGRISRLFKRTV